MKKAVENIVKKNKGIILTKETLEENIHIENLIDMEKVAELIDKKYIINYMGVGNSAPKLVAKNKNVELHIGYSVKDGIYYCSAASDKAFPNLMYETKIENADVEICADKVIITKGKVKKHIGYNKSEGKMVYFESESSKYSDVLKQFMSWADIHKEK